MNKGDIILIDFVARTEQNEIFDLTREDVAKKENIYNKDFKYEPIPVIIGADTTIPGLEDNLVGMHVGEEKTITIRPENGFGKRDPSMVKVFNEKIFQGKIKPAAGLIVDFSGRKGRIQSCFGGRVRIDFNHPLAGKVLIYDVKIVRQVTDTAEKIETIFSLFNLKPAVVVDGAKVEIKINGQLHPMIKEKITEMIREYAGVPSVSFNEKEGK